MKILRVAGAWTLCVVCAPCLVLAVSVAYLCCLPFFLLYPSPPEHWRAGHRAHLFRNWNPPPRG